MGKMRVLLIGDSIIDNGAYVRPGEPDVNNQLQALLPQHPVVKRALDGAICADVLRSQLDDLEREDRIILSVGGNDALQHIDLLEAATATTAREVLVRLWTVREDFRRDYAPVLDRLKGRPVLVLTVYNPCFDGHGMDATYQQAAESAVSMFDDVIQLEARRRSFKVLELRTLFTNHADYANPIEPSAIGGAKLAKAINSWVKESHAAGR
jgi:lysophospholipase L1-like esterase